MTRRAAAAIALGLAAALAVAAPVPVNRGLTPPARPADDSLPPGAVIRLGSSRFRTATGIQHLAASPDGKSVAAAGNGGVTVFAAATGRVTARLRNPPVVLALGYTPDGTLLTLGRREDDKTVVGRYDPATGVCFARVEVAGIASGDPVFSPDGALIAVGDGGDLAVYDARSGRRLAKIAFEKEPVNRVGFSPDNRWLGVTTEMDRFVVLDRVTGGEVFRTTFKRSVTHFEFTPDGAKVAVADDTPVVTIIDLPAGRVAARVKANAPTGWAALAPGGELLTTPVGAVAVIGYDPATGKQTRMIRTGASIYKVHLSPDGTTLLATTYAGAVRLWDVKTGRRLPASAAFPGDVGQLWFPEPGRLVGLADGVGWMRWDVRTGRQERFGPRDSTFTTSAIAPDGAHFVVKGGKGLRVVDAARKLVRRFRVEDEFGLNVSWFSPNGKELLGWGDAKLRVWDLGTGKHRDVAFGGEKDATALDVSPDGTRLAVGLAVGEGDARRGLVRVFDLATGKRVYEVPASDPPEDVVFGPDGTRFATFFRPDVAGGEFPPLCVHLHDAATGRVLRRARGPYIAQHGIPFSPDGRVIALAAEDNTLRLLEVESGKDRAAVTDSPDMWPGSAAFSPDGLRLATAGGEVPVTVWDLRGRAGPPPPAPDAAGLEKLWQALAAEDAMAAYRVMLVLERHPAAAVRLFRAEVKPAEPPDPAAVAGWVANLDSSAYRVRAAAYRELAAVADRAEPALLAALAKSESVEVREKLAAILAAADRPTPAAVRLVRAVEVLEYAGTDGAKALLREWAAGAPGAKLTAEAAAVVKRLP